MEYLFYIVPIFYFLIVIGFIYLFFKILDGIRKSNAERNEILREIHSELKRNNSKLI